MLKKGQQRRFSRRCLKENGLSTRPPIHLYRSTIESILTEGVLVSFGNTTTRDGQKYCQTRFKNQWFTTATGDTHLYLQMKKLGFSHPKWLLSPSTQPVCLAPFRQASEWHRGTSFASRIASLRRPSGCLTVALIAKCNYFLVYWMLV